MVKKKTKKKSVKVEKIPTKKNSVNSNTLGIATDKDIAMDFASKAYIKFGELIKSVILFGSVANREAKHESDIDIIVLIDDVSVVFDAELVAYYREELGKLLQANPYKRPLHVNSVKLTTWWQDLYRGDPTVLNVIRKGEVLIDHGGFFSPLKILLEQGKIRSTPEAIYTLLERAPAHIGKAKMALLGAVEGLHWATVDAAHAALIAAGRMPASPEHIEKELVDVFVSKKMIGKETSKFYEEVRILFKKISHNEIREVPTKRLGEMVSSTEKFVEQMKDLVEKVVK
jgi:predicted nucleotidyltransferase/polyhydroxyalkanoate synthesis regulator phasin